MFFLILIKYIKLMLLKLFLWSFVIVLIVLFLVVNIGFIIKI